MHYKRLRKSGEIAVVRHRQTGPCSVGDCERPAARKGWCAFHYQRWWKTGTTDDPPPRVQQLCTVPQCGEPRRANGLCVKHDTRTKRYGDPGITHRAPSGEGHLREDCLRCNSMRHQP